MHSAFQLPYYFPQTYPRRRRNEFRTKLLQNTRLFFLPPLDSMNNAPKDSPRLRANLARVSLPLLENDTHETHNNTTVQRSSVTNIRVILTRPAPSPPPLPFSPLSAKKLQRIDLDYLALLTALAPE